MKIAEYDVLTDELIVRDATDEETAEIVEQQAEIVAQAEAASARTVAREALLDKLGITAEEAQLLLGGM